MYPKGKKDVQTRCEKGYMPEKKAANESAETAK
jgi:hypothetical protein